SFIKNLSDKEETHTIVHAVAMIARSFNMKVVAEGVETASQLKILTKLAIDEVQGYYLSRPMSSEETSQLLIDGWKWPIDKI
ncbi:MAG TPA: EAL domain-containing protein, partial [Gammaproteobacteria bacterium]|nr:EAL domain-containing protein [Gammaproteobacteria bacterium]